MSKRGILLAVSSLPGNYGVGDFSDSAYKLIDILNKTGFDLWQILPLNPIGYGHSPYQTFSSYCFDEVYISLEDLQKRKLINKYKKLPQKAHSNFEKAKDIKDKAISEAFENFAKKKGNIDIINEFLNKNKFVDEYCEFITLKEFNNNLCWEFWKIKKEDRPEEFNFIKLKHAFAQMILFEEWDNIREYANKKNIEIIGDVPFYVGYDSSDVYFHRSAFYLDKEDKPSCLAGVPPDGFSEFGQRWGNPIYNWEYQSKHKFETMINRLVFASKMYDIVRIDHFRAFDSYWAINPKCPTAVDGEWRFPDGHGFFKELYKQYPKINLIVEDLGDLRPQVWQLRDAFNLPGMRELEYTIFDDEINDRNLERENQVYYVSTHDNVTVSKWIKNLKKSDVIKINKALDKKNIPGKDFLRRLVIYSFRRKEKIIIASAGDILGLTERFRMNKPGTIDNINWTFKLKELDSLYKGLKEVKKEL